MTDTPLDRAHETMQADPSDQAQMAYYGVLAAAELFVLLTEEPEGDRVVPELFDLGDARFVLAFDTEERLAGFAERIVPYVAMTGRSLAAMLSGTGTGIALNPEVAPSSTLLAPETLAWLAETLDGTPKVADARISEITSPAGLPEALLLALDRQLASTEGLARSAYLVGVTYEGGMRSHLLGFIGAPDGAQPALAGLVQEALTFSGLEAGALDVAFFAATDAMAARLARHGLRFDLPELDVPMQRSAPGSDPDKPPRLV